MDETEPRSGWWPWRRSAKEVFADPADELVSTELLMALTLSRAVRATDPLLQIVSHSARVAALAGWLAAELDVPEEDRAVLLLAARLHEVGMVGVPAELLDRRAPLSEEELERVRSHAWFGSRVVQAVHDRRAAALVEHQYSDYATLRERFPPGSRDLLLAGILRVADVFDAMAHPRPYQEQLSDRYRSEVLRSGMGTKFHPEVTRVLLRLPRQRS